MTITNTTWMKRDLAALWHPCTQMKDHEDYPMIPLRSGKGVWLEDFEGKRYLDAISSWWVNLFGHARAEIAEAIAQQAHQLEHAIFAGFTHEPAILLAERLIKLAPAGLTRCFLTDNGSSAVEVALKMSFHYWRNQGYPRKTKFIALQNSYHGETLGALAVGDVALYKRTYQPLLMQAILAPSPDAFLREPGESAAAYALRQRVELEALLAQHHEELCALIVEPLVQCAGAMRMFDAAYLRDLRSLCDRYQVHLIVDEIAVGFGRTGTMFGCEQGEVSPHFMCVAKGLTGGFLTLAAVLTTEDVYQAFYHPYTAEKAFLHSHSYCGNPLACRAALATLDLFASQSILENNLLLADAMRKASAHFIEHPHVVDVRQTGMILAIELAKDKTTRQPYPWQERRGMRVYQHGLERGVLLRPLGSVVYCMPPYVITEEEIHFMLQVAWEGIQQATVES